MDTTQTKGAPWFDVPANSFISVEHPCLVKNVDKAVDMLGGTKSISEALQEGDERSLSLNFTPKDPASRSIMSLNNKTNNVLLKITVPARTGRKRKRGSDDLFTFDDKHSTLPKDARHLMDALVNNPARSKIEPLGNIESTHVWRSMPDFVYSTKGSTFLHNIQSKILPQDYLSMKEWVMPKTYGLTDTEVYPLPVMSNVSLPQNYTYRQNTAIKPVVDAATGTKKLSTLPSNHQLHTHQCKELDDVYPSAPAESSPPLSEQAVEVQELYPIILNLFEQRPLWTRRALINQLPENTNTFYARQAMSYVAFALRAGPWRDALCKLGVDPRTDCKYRKYQTVLLQLMSKDKNKEAIRDEYARTWTVSTNKTSHIFTGQQKVSSDGKVWQLCDLDDPQLKVLVDISDEHIRTECERRYFGWYLNGTMAKIRVLLKTKVDALIAGTPCEDSVFANFLTLPENADDLPDKLPNNILNDPIAAKYYLPKDSPKFELELTATYRALCRTAEAKAPRTNKLIEDLSKAPEPTELTSINTTPTHRDGDDLQENDLNGAEVRQPTSAEADAAIAADFGEPVEDDEGLEFGEEQIGLPGLQKKVAVEDVEMTDA